MNATGKYLYGIIQEPELKTYEFHGLEGAAVYTVNHLQLAAVVSDTGLVEIDPTRRNVMAHTLVQDELLKRYTVLPMGFGTVAASEESVRKLLGKNSEALTAELAHLAGKIEGDLKIFWDEKAMMSENQEMINKLKLKIGSAPSPVEAQRLALEAGMTIEKIVREWRATYANKVYSSLKLLASDAKLNNPVGVQNLLNVSFLIDRAREGEFVERVRKLDAEYKGKMNFKYVGPLSPYNFVGLTLKLVK